MKLKILVCYHKKDELLKNDILTPIHAGRACACEASKDGEMSPNEYKWLLDNMIGDDTGDNISKLNREINEWSALYWAWKNYDKLGNPDYIGLMHYRRLFDFSDKLKTKGKNLINNCGLNAKNLDILLSKYEFIYREGFKIIDKNYLTFDCYQTSTNLSEDYHPILYKEYKKFQKEKIFYCNNMFIMKKEDFFIMCEEIFPLMFDILKKPKNIVMSNFLEFYKNNTNKELYNLIYSKYKDNNNWYPRYTSYLLEYISSFYFMKIKERYREKALSCPIRIIIPKQKTKLINKIFSIKNEYSENKKYKVLTIAGLKIKKKIQSNLEKALARRYAPDITINEKKLIIEDHFEKCVGYKPNIDNPQSFNEKLQWLKLYNEDPLLTKCADKYLVRDYIKEKIGEKYLIPLLGVWDKAEDIDFDKLPEQFVLKVNWGSGQNIIVKDKSTIDIEATKQKLQDWLKPEANHYFASFEWCYKNIQPKIIAEEFIEQNDNDLYDYKFLSYNGKVKNLFVISNRYSDMRLDFYDTQWNLLPFERVYRNSKNGIKKPENFDEMLKLAQKLSEDFIFARIDFYIVNNQIYIGEITFYPGNGTEAFTPQDWDFKLGELIKLEKEKK